MSDPHADNLQRLRRAFAKSFSIPETEVTDALSYQGLAQWDSMAHMGLIAVIEEEFGIMFDTDDVIDLSSFAKARTIVQKYGIVLHAG